MGNSQDDVRDLQAKPGDDVGTIPEDAFVIIDGIRVIPLNLAIVNIGRRIENTLVVDDPRVSSTHAQLRSINGRYIIFDLNSTGGTFVNGKKVNQSVLYPGDVISLAGVPLIYGQDTTSDLSNTTLITPKPSPNLHLNPQTEVDVQLKRHNT